MKKQWKNLCCLMLVVFSIVSSACGTNTTNGLEADEQTTVIDTAALLEKSDLSYMIYYGSLNEDAIEEAKQYDLVIVHPRNGNITRKQVQKIRSAGTCVLGYISIGEDLRTAGMTAEQMLRDERFIGDGSGPRVDPREDGVTSLDGVDVMGEASSGGTGYASYYLDDNDHDGTPDFNVNFNCAFTNIGDPEWFEVLNAMTMDGKDRIPGIKEILTDDYGRGLGCDANKTRFEWTSVGVESFMQRLKEQYPDKLILQNRGLFFYNPQLEQFKYSPGEYIDFLLYESYMLDSNTYTLYIENYFLDNKYNYMPRIMAEAGRPNGFKVLSLGYAEGPEEYQLKDTLLGKSEIGLEILLEDIYQAEEIAGFSHYISNGAVTLVNDFVRTHTQKEDVTPPEWSSVYNASSTWPAEAPTPRVGIGEVEAIEGGVIVRWDVALDQSGVEYILYCQKEPFDFSADPYLTKAARATLVPEMGEGYEDGINADTYPYQATITGLLPGETYYFVIRAKDNSANKNEEQNTVVLSVMLE